MKKLIALILASICLFCLFGCEINSQASLMKDGPWGSQAIWFDEGKQMYLICKQEEGQQYATVNAYLFALTEWYALECSWNENTKMVVFSASNQTVLAASAKLEGDTLRLYDFYAPNGNFSGMRLDLTLNKYAYDAYVDKLPAGVK